MDENEIKGNQEKLSYLRGLTLNIQPTVNGLDFELGFRPKNNPFQKIFGAERIDAPMELKIIRNQRQMSESKNTIGLENFIFLNTFNNIWKGNIECNYMNKNYQILNFDVPKVKLNFTHEEYPLNIYFKYKNYCL